MDPRRLPAPVRSAGKTLRRVAGKATALVRRPSDVPAAPDRAGRRLLALKDNDEVRALAKQVRDTAASTTMRVIENKHFLVVEIPAEARAAFDQGSLDLMASKGAKKAALVATRDVHVGGTPYRKGQVVRHANARAMGNAAKAARVLGPAAYQLASIAVAQDHLAEIRQRLQSIDAKLDHLVQDIHHETASVLKQAEFEQGLVWRALDRQMEPDPGQVFGLEAALKAVRQRLHHHQPRVLERHKLLAATQDATGAAWVGATGCFLRDAQRWMLDMVSYDLACRSYNRCVATLAATYELHGDGQDDWLEAIEGEAVEVFDALEKARACMQGRGIVLEDLERVGYQKWERIPLHQRRKQRRQAITAYEYLQRHRPGQAVPVALLIGDGGDVFLESDEQ